MRRRSFARLVLPLGGAALDAIDELVQQPAPVGVGDLLAQPLPRQLDGQVGRVLAQLLACAAKLLVDGGPGVGANALGRGFAVAESLRDGNRALRVDLNLGGGSFKSQLKRADKCGAAYAVILGDDEVARNEAGLKPLRTDEDQLSVPLDDLAKIIGERLAG